MVLMSIMVVMTMAVPVMPLRVLLHVLMQTGRGVPARL